MSRVLLDTSVLLALLDADHLDHWHAREWFEANGEPAGWASCAITQNGFVRIISQPRYPNSVAVSAAAARLAEAASSSLHEFWPCEVSITNGAAIDRSRLYGPAQVTDAYLLALAVAHGGRLLTLDQNVPRSAVPGAGDEHLVVL